MRSFYQDRLGTNIGKTPKKSGVFFQLKPLLDKTIQWAQDNLIYKETRREAGTIFEQDLDDDRRCVRAARAAAADQTDREERANRKHLSIRPISRANRNRPIISTGWLDASTHG